jgi:predicted PurR-regulated permease PerM
MTSSESERRAHLLRNAGFWLVAGFGLILFLYVFSSVLLPFMAGMALAYFLDPVADRLQKLGMSRLLATVFILIVCVLALLIALMVLIPVLTTQLVDFATRLPEYLSQLHALIISFDPEWFERELGVKPGTLQDGVASLLSQGTGFITGLFRSLWSSGLAIVNLVSLFVVTPVVAFYLLLDWDRMVEHVDSLIPRNHLSDVRQIARDINSATAGFVRGQGTLCLILGIYYATGLTLVGLNFGLLIGLFAGLISFIPYVGSLVGLGLAVSVAGLVLGCRGSGRFLQRPVRRRQHSSAQAGGQERRPPSGVAYVRTFCLWISLWICGIVDCCPGCGSRCCASAFRHWPLSGVSSL